MKYWCDFCGSPQCSGECRKPDHDCVLMNCKDVHRTDLNKAIADADQLRSAVAVAVPQPKESKPRYGTVKMGVQIRREFTYENERVTIEGTCDSVQDLRDALRDMLRVLEESC